MGMTEIVFYLQKNPRRAFTARQLADALGISLHTVRVSIGRLRAHEEYSKVFHTLLCEELTQGGVQAVARHFYKKKT